VNYPIPSSALEIRQGQRTAIVEAHWLTCRSAPHYLCWICLFLLPLA